MRELRKNLDEISMGWIKDGELSSRESLPGDRRAQDLLKEIEADMFHGSILVASDRHGPITQEFSDKLVKYYERNNVSMVLSMGDFNSAYSVEGGLIQKDVKYENPFCHVAGYRKLDFRTPSCTHAAFTPNIYGIHNRMADLTAGPNPVRQDVPTLYFVGGDHQLYLEEVLEGQKYRGREVNGQKPVEYTETGIRRKLEPGKKYVIGTGALSNVRPDEQVTHQFVLLEIQGKDYYITLEDDKSLEAKL